MRFPLAVAQFAPEKGKLEQNIARIAETVQQCESEGVELVVFPEAIVSGYFLEGGVLECALSSIQLFERLNNAVKLSRPVDVLVGFYEVDGGNLYNSAAYLQLGPHGRVVHVYRKFFLATYGVFDDERYVTRGRQLGVFDSRLGRMAILICEDVWHTILSALAAAKGAQVVLVPSASPARGFDGETIGNLERYGRMLRAVSDEHGVYCANSQLIGFEGGKGFVGGSSIVDPLGRTIAQAPIGEDALTIAEVDTGLIEIARSQLPLTADLQTVWSDIKRIVAES